MVRMNRKNEERGFTLYPVFTLKEWLDLLVIKRKWIKKSMRS